MEKRQSAKEASGKLPDITTNLIVDDLNSYDLYDADGIRRASLTFTISLFTQLPLNDLHDIANRYLDLFLSLCPANNLSFYATEKMQKHRLLNKKSLGKLIDWLAQPQNGDYQSLELKDGNHLQDAPKFQFKFTAAASGSLACKAGHANSFTLSFDPTWGLHNAQQLEELMLKLLSELPCVCATAGFAYQCSRYLPKLGEIFARQMSMQHPEIDIVRIPQDHRAVKQNGLKTVAWLTMIGNPLIEQLGDADSIIKGLSNAITPIAVPGGLLFRIGRQPVFSGKKRAEFFAEYKELHYALRSLIEKASEQALWFASDSDDQDEEMNAWFRRLEQ